jgi:hypothetical protein
VCSFWVGTWDVERAAASGRCAIGDDLRLSRPQDLALPSVLRSRRGVTGGGGLRVDAGPSFEACRAWAWSTILITFPELRIPR